MKKYENFQKALKNLHLIENYQPPFDVLTLTGMVALFEICFEQSWKAMKESLFQYGYDESKTGSPRMVIKLAYSAGMIDDEQTWLQALNDRNNVAHSYNEEIALDIVSHVKAQYIAIFDSLDRCFRENWNEWSLS